MSAAKPVPAIDHLSAPYWEGCRAGRLLLQTCTACGTPRFPPGPVCTACRSPESTWIESSGRARVYSWIVVRHPVPAEVYAGDVPYVVALVELHEGIRMPTNIVDCEPAAIKVNMALELCFREIAGGTQLPQFRPASGSD